MFACLNASCRSCLLALYARYQLMPWPDFQSSKGLKSPSGKFPFLSGEAPEHETDHCETDERGRLASVTLVVACQPTTAADPGQGALHDPSFRQHDELVPVAAAHDLKLPTAGAGDGGLHLLPLIAGVADVALDEREAPSGLAEQSPALWASSHATGFSFYLKRGMAKLTRFIYS